MAQTAYSAEVVGSEFGFPKTCSPRFEHKRLFAFCRRIYLQILKRVFRIDTLRQLVAEATTEMNTFNIYKKVYLSNLFMLIIIQILRLIVKSNNKKRSVPTKNELCFQIMSYITTNIYTINALTEVADVLNYDYSYLSKLFVATPHRL